MQSVYVMFRVLSANLYYSTPIQRLQCLLPGMVEVPCEEDTSFANCSALLGEVDAFAFPFPFPSEDPTVCGLSAISGEVTAFAFPFPFLSLDDVASYAREKY